MNESPGPEKSSLHHGVLFRDSAEHISGNMWQPAAACGTGVSPVSERSASCSLGVWQAVARELQTMAACRTGGLVLLVGFCLFLEPFSPAACGIGAAATCCSLWWPVVWLSCVYKKDLLFWSFGVRQPVAARSACGLAVPSLLQRELPSRRPACSAHLPVMFCRISFVGQHVSAVM